MRTILLWVGYWIMVIDGLIGVVTLGFYCPHMSLDYAAWRVKRSMTK